MISRRSLLLATTLPVVAVLPELKFPQIVLLTAVAFWSMSAAERKRWRYVGHPAGYNVDAAYYERIE